MQALRVGTESIAHPFNAHAVDGDDVKTAGRYIVGLPCEKGRRLQNIDHFGGRPQLWTAFDAVSDSEPIVRPWNAPMNAMNCVRPVL